MRRPVSSSPLEPGTLRAGWGGRDDLHGSRQRSDGHEDQDLPGRAPAPTGLPAGPGPEASPRSGSGVLSLPGFLLGTLPPKEL